MYLFLGVFIFPIESEVEIGLHILRVAFCYRRIVSVDWFLNQMLVPYKFSDLFSVFNGEIRTNLDVTELVEEKYKSLSDVFAMTVELMFINKCSCKLLFFLKLDCTIGMRKNMVVMILEVIALLSN